MGEHVDGDAADGVEGREQEHGLGGAEPEDGAALGDDDERLLVQEVRVDVADRRARELQGELAEPTRKIVACRKLAN